MMDPKRTHSSNWYQAITLSERITSLHAIDGAKATAMSVDSDLAMRRMNQWRSQKPFTTDSRFSQRVALDGISEAEFLHFLGEPAESVRKRFFAPPSWLVALLNAFSTIPPANALPFPASSAAGKGAAFIEALEPVIRRGRDRLREGINALVQSRFDLPFDRETTTNSVHLGSEVWMLSSGPRQN